MQLRPLKDRYTPAQLARRYARMVRREGRYFEARDAEAAGAKPRYPLEIPRWTPKNSNAVGASTFLEARQALYAGLHGLQRKIVIRNLLLLFDEMERRSSIRRCKRVPNGRSIVQKALDRLHRVKGKVEVPCGGRVRPRYEERLAGAVMIDACTVCGATA